MVELKNCRCYYCGVKRVKQKITNYEWESYILKQLLLENIRNYPKG